MTRGLQRGISFGVLVSLAIIWELTSYYFTDEIVPGVSMIPGWKQLFTMTFLSLSDYWTGGFGVESGDRNYAAATLAVLSHSADTLLRLYVGLFAGAFVGLALGLAVSWSSWTRRLIDLPVKLLCAMPLLAMVPLFQLWFGIHFMGKIAFIGYGVGVLFVAGTVNAVKNVPKIYVDGARVLGANKFTIYRTVVIPAIFPELQSTILLSLGTAWAAVIGAEYLGAQSGLGYILIYAQQFGFVDRMFFVAILFIVYASISYAIFNAISDRILVWVPRSTKGRSPANSPRAA